MTNATNNTAANVKADPMAAMIASNEVAQKIVADDKAKTDKGNGKKAQGDKKAAPKVDTKKTEAAPKARATRPAQAKKETTPAAKTVAVASAIVAPVPFMLNPSIRPGAGAALFSHTEAVLQALDMYKGKAYAFEVLAALMGATAIAYHEKKGRFMAGKNGLSLTSDGKEHFQKRGLATNKERFVAQDVEAYGAIFKTGEIDGRVVKNKAMVKAFAPAASRV